MYNNGHIFYKYSNSREIVLQWFIYNWHIKQNKIEIPSSFLADKTKNIYSTQFAYDSYMTLVSYTPKVKDLK